MFALHNIIIKIMVMFSIKQVPQVCASEPDSVYRLSEETPITGYRSLCNARTQCSVRIFSARCDDLKSIHTGLG